MAKKYEQYKDSGVEWIGDIPEHWEVYRTKFLFSLIAKPSGRKHDLELLSIYTDIGVKPRQELKEKGNKASSTDGYWLVKKGDFIVNKLLAWMGAIGLSEYDGVTSPAYDILRKNKILDEYFYNYLFRCSVIFEEFKKYSKGIMEMRLRLYFTEFGKIFLVYPPIQEQNSIVDYLNKKSEAIDRFIENKEELINLLEEEKKERITKAVTKGLDKNVNFKSSNIEWLGEIPVHWELMKLKYLIKDRLKYGANEEATLEDRKLPRYIRITDFNDNGNLNDSTFRSLKEEVAKNYLLKEGDILFARSGATVGKTFQFKNYNGIACYAGYLIKATPNSLIKSDFLYIYTMSNVYSEWKDQVFTQATIQNISAEKYANLFITVPPLEEQQAIVAYLDEETKKTDDLKAKYRQEIELIKEYKERLIYDVVTGKMSVLEH